MTREERKELFDMRDEYNATQRRAITVQDERRIFSVAITRAREQLYNPATDERQVIAVLRKALQEAEG